MRSLVADYAAEEPMVCTCHQLTAANTITGTVVIPFSHLFERMRDMGSSLSGQGVTLPRRFCIQVRTTSP